MFMETRCGAWQVGEDVDRGRVEFRVFFPAGFDPHLVSIRVGGDFQAIAGAAGWDFAGGVPLVADTSDPRGTFWVGRTAVDLPAGFYEYKYLVTFDNGSSRIVTDPCTRYGGLSNRNSGVVVGGSSPSDNVVRGLPGGRLPLTDLTLYELMIDDFTSDYRTVLAPLEAVESRLDYLVAIGVTGVLFMPWTSWKNDSFDWGYEPFQYFAVETRYINQPAQPAEKLSRLKHLIGACHDRGIHVIMDGVFNHVSYEFPYDQLFLNPADCPFTARTFGGSFPGLQDLDFANPCTQSLIEDVCRYWIDTFGIDGIRLDNTVNYYVPGDLHGLPELLASIADYVAGKGEVNFSLTLEHIDVSAATVTNTTSATSFWDNSLHEVTFDALWNGRVGPRLLNALNNRRYLSASKVPTLYLSNHDHSHVTWQAGAGNNVGATGAWWRVQPFLIALFTSTAVPLVPNGQELGEEYFLPEDDHGTGRRVTPRPVRWKIAADPIGQTLQHLHGRLGTLRRAHPALRSGQMYPDYWDEWQTQLDPTGVGLDVDRQLAVYHRWATLPDSTVENAVVVLNFSDTDQTLTVPFPYDGPWTDALTFPSTGGLTVTVQDRRSPVSVPSHYGRIFFPAPIP